MVELDLSQVKRPGRYIGGEWNSVKKPRTRGPLGVCLVFPELCEVGFSNLGMQIIYGVINARRDARCERAYAPDLDMEGVLRSQRLPLCSLESGTPLAEFDIVGFTLQYELSYTNILNILDLAGLPLRASARAADAPLVIAGGPCAGNPEPLADFIDAFIIGDGEDVIGEIIDTVKSWKNPGRARRRSAAGLDKRELLLALAKIPGVYVPALYPAAAQPSAGALTAPAAPDVVDRRVVDLETAFFPVKPVVPFVRAVHDRLSVEIMRGCPHGCRFCQAQKLYFPRRVRSQKKILELIKKSLPNTGYDEVGLTSLSTSDYPGIEELVDEIAKCFPRLGISLPSLRCEPRSVRLAAKASGFRKTSLTFAPEGGTERMRASVGKNLSEAEICGTLALARSEGFQLAKLYFMVGLPGESQEDVNGIWRLVKTIRRASGGLNIHIGASSFVPKPHTPFQWLGFERCESLEDKLRGLKSRLPQMKYPDVRISYLEAVFSRGDRSLGAVLEEAFKAGCRFDQWGEYFNPTRWKDAFDKAGVNPDAHAYRTIPLSDKLPWGRIRCHPSEKLLKIEFIDSKLDMDCPPVSSPHSPAADFHEPAGMTAHHVPPASLAQEPPKPSFEYRIDYAKRPPLNWLSHLETVMAMERAFRRAGLPLAYTRGFNPHPKMSYSQALKTGASSENEWITVHLEKKIAPAALRVRINKILPAGLSVLKVSFVTA